MTYKEWEKKLLKSLKPLPKQERDLAVEYYREMYGDKTDAGMHAEDILREFGTPISCAERILNENGLTYVAEKEPKEKSSVGWWIALSFLTLLLIAPIYACIFSVVIAFGAIVIVGGATALAGGVYVLISPFLATQGLDFWGVISHMGIGFAGAGVGFLLTLGFFFATKYLFAWTIQSLGFIYKRR